MNCHERRIGGQRLPRRRPMRMPHFDYAWNAAYFVTICAAQRRCLFGAVENGVVQLSDIGQIVDEAWSEVTAHRPGVMLDLWVVMPNHVHGIVVLPGSANPPGPHPMASDGPQQGSLGAVIGGFKSAASREARRGNLVPDGVLWQRGYYDRIIRNARELDAIRQYIADNPVRWADDPENPERFEPESFGSNLQR